MAQQNNIAQQLNDLLVTRNFHPDMLDAQGKVCDSEDAKTFTFDYISGAGKNYGTMVVILDSDNDLKAFYGDNLGRSMEGDDKDEFFDFQQHLSQFANAHRYTYTAKDLGQLKHTMQGLAAIKEGLFEGYYGTRRISYAGEPTEARLMIRHNRNLGETDARFRYVESIFVETADGERYRLPFTNLAGGRAMLEHVRQGGKPYDVRGNHICEMITELKVLTRFNRASQGRVLEGITQGVVEGAQTYYKSLRENIKRLSSPRGYSAYFESWHPADITEQDQLVEDIKTLFVEQTIDDRIEQALPLLAKIQRGREMKEADIFENWVNTLAEGTWSLPETPEQLTRLKTLMSGELIVGPDGTNATEQLYDLIGDDVLFDRIRELAQQDPRANLWDDSMVQDRMQELGIQMPDRAAPDMAAQPQQGVAEGSLEEDKGMKQYWAFKREWRAKHGANAKVPDYDSREYTAWQWRQADKQQGVAEGSELKQAKRKYNQAAKDANLDQVSAGKKIDTMKKSLRQKDLGKEQGVAEADNIAAFESLQRMRHLSGMPLAENALNDSGSTLGHIIQTYQRDVRDFILNGDMSDHLYDALYDYYFDDMPYGVKKARTGDPYEWIGDRFHNDMQGHPIVDECLGGIVGEGNVRLQKVPSPNMVTIQGIPSANITSHPLDDEPLPHTELNYRPMPQGPDISLPYTELKPRPVMGVEIINPSPVKGIDLTQGDNEQELEECNYTMENDYCPVHGLKECWLEEMNQSILATGSRLIEDLDEDMTDVGDVVGQAARSVTNRLGQAASDMYEPIGNFVKGVKQGWHGTAQTTPRPTAAVAMPVRSPDIIAYDLPAPDTPFIDPDLDEADMMNPEIPSDFGSDSHLRDLLKLSGAYQAGDRSALKKSNDAMLDRMTKSDPPTAAPSFSAPGAAHAGQGGYDYSNEEPDQSDAETARLSRAGIPDFVRGEKNIEPDTPVQDLDDEPDQSDAETARLGRSINYESREGDAMLARIKSLALIR